MKINTPTGLIFGVFSFIVLGACLNTISSSGTVINGLQFEISDEEFTAINISDQAVYYFAIESVALALIDWVPISTEENRINPRQKFTLSIEELRCCNDEGELSFFYWHGNSNQENYHLYHEYIQHVRIDPKTKKVYKI